MGGLNAAVEQQGDEERDANSDQHVVGGEVNEVETVSKHGEENDPGERIDHVARAASELGPAQRDGGYGQPSYPSP
jgi:hypothetical protein